MLYCTDTALLNKKRGLYTKKGGYKQENCLLDKRKKNRWLTKSGGGGLSLPSDDVLVALRRTLSGQVILAQFVKFGTESKFHYQMIRRQSVIRLLMIGFPQSFQFGTVLLYNNGLFS